MILSRSALHGAVVALSFSAPALADDVIVDGKHCNDICQSWLGVKHDETGKISARHVVVEPKPVRTSPVTEPVRTAPVKEAVRTPAATEPVRSLPAPRPVRTDPVAEPARALPAAKPLEAQQVTTPPAALPSATQASTRVDPPGQDDGTVADTPEAAEGSEPPQPSKLVAVRGSIIIQSASEKAADEQQKARLTKEMTRSAVLP